MPLLEHNGYARRSAGSMPLKEISSSSPAIAESVLTCGGIVYSCCVIHATSDEVKAIWGPGQIVDLSTRRGPTHVFYPPGLLIV